MKEMLGKKVKDKVSGFKGIATCVSHFLNGCTRVTVQPGLDKDGKYQEDRWFDSQQMEVMEEKPAHAPSTASTGGPQTSQPTHSI